MLKTRILSAVIGIPILFVLAWLGGGYWIALTALLAAISLYEIFRGLQTQGNKPLWVLGYLILILGLSRTFLSAPAATSSLAALLVLSIILMVFLYPRYHIMDLAVSWFYPGYVGLFMGYALRLAGFEQHFVIIVFGLILTWASDTGGYFAGSWWGRHKLAPLLSPKKTWEGFAGGFILTIAVSLAGMWFVPNANLFKLIVLGTAAGVLAPIGDLFASAIKRDMTIKDFGDIIPGHGGILDRFDSFMIISPLIYYFVKWLGG